MTRLLYESDPYLRSFDAQVLRVRGEWVMLDRTAFFPGGGGQEADTGWMAGLEVQAVRLEGEVVAHRVPGHALSPGDKVDCEIDWERRHDLMRGHTGEHLLFSVLSKIHPELELVKIAITPAKKSFIVKGEMSWPLLAMAQREANEAIFAQVPVSDSWVPKDSELIEAIRIKVERIHGDQVRIVQIGELDKAACAGVHVSNTREIRMLLVTGLTSARPAGDFEIEFETGRKAMETALGLSAIGLQAAEALRAQTEDLLNAVQNLKAEAHRAQESLREYAAQALSRLEPERLEGVRLYSGAFRGVDKRTLVDAANAMVRGERTAAILASVDERLMMLVATSNDLEVDSRLILSEALSPIGGRGGGGRNFASGGANDGAGAEAALAAAKGALLKTLSK